MPCRLLVILGAGASYDCSVGGGSLHPEFRPPLVTQLFENRQAFTRILREYPLAQKAAADIRPAIGSGSVAIEAFLRDRLRDSEFEHRRCQYWAIPLYLQHLLFVVSRWDYAGSGYAEQPDAYDRLINAVLQVDQVTFASLNYDDIFDQRLFAYDHLSSLESYLGPGRNWALIKLHGSINWGRRTSERVVGTPDAQTDPFLAGAFASTGDRLELDTEIVLRPQNNLRDIRLDPPNSGNTLFYPAVSAPLGEEDELVCPPNHVQYLKDVTGHYDPLDVLVIGYSGLDHEVISILSWGGRPIRSLTVVSDNLTRAQETADRIMAGVRIAPAYGEDSQPALWVGGFANFAQGAYLEDYIARIRQLAQREDERTAQLRAGQMPTDLTRQDSAG